jgi:transposase
MKAPNRLDFTPEEIDSLIQRLKNKCLEEKDYSLLTEVLRAMIWLSFSLQEKELSIKRLRNIFGIKTESAQKLLELVHGKPLEQNNGAEIAEITHTESDLNKDSINKEDEKGASQKGKKKAKKNHGHRPSTDYSEAKIIDIAHQNLKKGSTCPDCLKGRLFQLKSGTVLRIVGQPWLQVEIYRPERLRCSLCGKIFTAILPTEVAIGSRADSSAKAIVSLLKYRGGVPFYRQGQIQEILGAPISASEIWEMTEDVADALLPVYARLCKEAAQAELLHNDDTAAKILSRMEELKTSKAERTGTVTSCIIAVFKKTNIRIGLFFTGWKHAGENLDELLEERSEELSIPIQQCDALSRNIPKDNKTQLSNCLSHLRRKFYELVDVWPQEVIKIIGDFAVVFSNDHSAPKNAEERLKWHQEKSHSSMDGIKEYCNNLIKEKKAEPNSSMGKTIAYLNNHWEAFTLFLRVSGVPLTNNAGERLIKRAVLNRKNAYFYRNETGAKIADILMSSMETCVLNDINPYLYLIAVQKYKKDVFENPAKWLPWVYEERLKTLQAIHPQSQFHPP